MTSKDLSIFNSLRPFSIGYDDMFDQFESMLGNGSLALQSNYPPMLITTSLFDNRVLYSEPVKYIAKLRETKTDNNIQLLKCKMEAAGHGGMSGRDNAITELAEEYSFILKSAKILK